MSKEYQGGCHCGAVRFIYSGLEIRNGVYCNCSICARKGALMNTEPISPENLKIEFKNDALAYMNSARKLPSTISANTVEYIHSTRLEANPDFTELI